MRLATKTSLLLIVCLFLSLLGNGVLLVSFFANTLEQNRIERNLDLVERLSATLRGFLDETVRDISFISHALDTSENDPREYGSLLGLLWQSFPSFAAGILQLSPEGEILAAYPDGDLVGRRIDPSLLQGVRTRGGAVPVAVAEGVFGGEVLPVAAPLHHDGVFAGYLLGGVRINTSDALQSIFSIGIGRHQHLFLVHDAGIYVSPVEEVPMQVTQPRGIALVREALQGRHRYAGGGGGLFGDGVLVYHRIFDTGWVLGLEEDRTGLDAILKTATGMVTWFALGTAAIGALIGTCLMRRYLRPLRRLKEAMEGLEFDESQQGNICSLITARLPRTEKGDEDEIGALSRSYIRMADRLQRTFAETRAVAANWEQTFNSVEDAIFILDAEMRIEQANLAACRLVGKPLEELTGRNCCMLIHGDLAPVEHCPTCLTMVEGKSHTQRLELANDLLQGYFEVVSTPMFLDQGTVLRTIHIFRDLTRRKKDEEQIRHLANNDTLTGLPRRGHFLEQLRRLIVASREKGLRVAVLSLDIDRFKEINDVYGHPQGDQVLREVARRIAGGLTPSDLVGRHSSDEYLVGIGDLKSPGEAAAVVELLQQTIRRPLEVAGRLIPLSVSIGVAVIDDFDGDLDGLLKQAEIAMYQSKEQGGGVATFFSHELNRAVMDRLNLMINLRHALQNGEFSLYYQPQSDLKSGRVVAMEALLRWYSPDIGMVSPAQFIPLAEESGLIVPIGEWVLRTACLFAKRMHDEGYAGLRVAVNVSPRQFAEADFIDRVEAVLHEVGFDPRLLELEVTESLMLANAEETIKTLTRLKELGICIAMDDFGTGYSSLSNLKRLPIDRLKIDRAFVKDIITDPDDASIVEVIIAIAHNLGMKVLAEGVEGREQLDYLYRRGCDEVQGYYLARPMAEADFLGFLQEIVFELPEAEEGETV